MATKTKAKKETVQTQTKTNLLRRSALAYVGLYGMAYEHAVKRWEQARVATNTLFEDLVAKGEVIETQANTLVKETQLDALKGYANVSETVQERAGELKSKVEKFVPGMVDTPVEALEEKVATMKKKLDTLKKSEAPAKSVKKTAAKKKPVKKMTTERTKVAKVSAEKPAPKATPKPVVAKTTPVKKAAAKTVETKKADTATAKPAPKAKAEKKEPRHIPYFNDVKRYDPFASEDIVRKIVNHCSIALQSEDTRYVACSDETERNRVRDSWLKKKLGVEGSDAALDKKVQNVCSIMQRDLKKNRVTFYYLSAKAERKLDTL